jgi:RNA-directed DNA polymerase
MKDSMVYQATLDMSQRRATRKALEEALEDIPSLKDTFSTSDPYLLTFKDELNNHLAINLKPYWPSIEKILKDIPREIVLRHAWAIAVKDPIQLACLYRSAISDNDLKIQNLAELLFQKTKDYTKSNFLAQQIAKPSDILPDLSVLKFLMPGMKVRYRLASALARKASLDECISSVMKISGATQYIQKRELSRFIIESKKLNFNLKPFTTAQFILKSRSEQRLILSSKYFIDNFLSTEIKNRKEINPWLENMLAYRQETFKNIGLLTTALKDRNFLVAENLISDLNPDPLTRLILSLSEKQDSFIKKAKAPKGITKFTSNENKWQSLSIEKYDHLKKLLPRLSIPIFWTWSASKIADEISTSNFTQEVLGALEIELLRNSWSVSDARKLIAHGFQSILATNSEAWSTLNYAELFSACAKRNDFNEILKIKLEENPSPDELLDYFANEKNHQYLKILQRITTKKFRIGQALSSKIGSEKWKIIGGWKIHGTNRLEDIYTAFNLPNLELEVSREFKNTTIEGLITFPAKNNKKEFSRPRLMKNSYEVTRDLVVEKKIDLEDLLKFSSLKWTIAFLEYLADYPELLDEAQLKSPVDKAEAIYSLRVNKAPIIGKRLLSLFVEGAQKGYPIEWDPSWTMLVTKENNRNSSSVAALIVVLRNNLKKLRRIMKIVPNELINSGLALAVKALKGLRGRDHTTLELTRVLGFDVISHLSAVTSKSNYKSETGKRLDHMYLKWSLPKKSGGVRIISTPSPSLKIVQRRILEKLLDPLGFHNCAYGFAKGKSIKDNALAHVGNPIVANVDISNCFPSVRWQLVLGVMRRDLGAHLSSSAISTLVDICTADGGLPIGAPTSPALLNRVLIVSDRILEDESKKRSCNYSRYADDLTFSGEHGAIEMIGVSKGVLGRIGLSLDPKKTNIFRKGRRQVVTGLVVNQQVSVPRRIRRRLRAAVHSAENRNQITWQGREQSLHSLDGRLSFLTMIHFKEGQALKSRLRAIYPTKKLKKRPPNTGVKK